MEKLGLGLYFEEKDANGDSSAHDPAQDYHWPCYGVPVHGRDLPYPVQDRKDGAYRLLLQYHAKRHSLAEGILLNSFMELEADTIEAMQNEEIGKIPHINPVGPIIQSGSVGTSGSECLKYWFDNQPKGSVFAKSNKDPFSFLPKGFLDRTIGQVFLSEVALRPKVNEDGLVGREDTMQGEKGVATHDRMIRLKGSCGQSSERRGLLGHLVSKLKNRKSTQTEVIPVISLLNLPD
ncbi:hypothetical protein Peur_022344 [Populus x canadensis]